MRGRLLPKPTQNVVAEVGDLRADRMLVVMAHHDAAPTGLFFDQTGQEWFARRFPAVIERQRATFPNWWLTLAGPALIALGALRRRRGLIRAGTISSAASAVHTSPPGRAGSFPGTYRLPSSE